MLVTGCVTVASDSAICSGTEALRTVHAKALVEDGGDRSVVTGQALIATMDVGCQLKPRK